MLHTNTNITRSPQIPANVIFLQEKKENVLKRWNLLSTIFWQNFFFDCTFCWEYFMRKQYRKSSLRKKCIHVQSLLGIEIIYYGLPKHDVGWFLYTCIMYFMRVLKCSRRINRLNAIRNKSDLYSCWFGGGDSISVFTLLLIDYSIEIIWHHKWVRWK